jgi:hypothetical protein
MTRLPYSYQAQIMGRRSFEKMYTADQMREYAKRVVADEREACAKVCDAYGQMGLGANSAANAIRARGQA